ncbi:hypothetical protein BJX99DRAFT_224118 [Aspergillus californicus]
MPSRLVNESSVKVDPGEKTLSYTYPRHQLRTIGLKKSNLLLRVSRGFLDACLRLFTAFKR